MNILFFLTPKEDVTYIHDSYTLGQTLEKMEEHKFSCIPIINDRGKYVGNPNGRRYALGAENRSSLNMKAAEEVPITSLRDGRIMLPSEWTPTWKI